MTDSNEQELPSWMVPNGATWTLPSTDFHSRAEPDADIIDISPHGKGRPLRDTILILNDSFHIVGDGYNWGWTSIACGSDSMGWVNLVVHDGLDLSRVLIEAVNRRYRDFHTVDNMLDLKPFGGKFGKSYRELLVETATVDSSASQPQAVDALETVTVIWELIFSHFQLVGEEGPLELSMLMYGDGGLTMNMLEEALYLPSSFSESEVNREDLRLSSALSRLRVMTSWVSRGSDIDKRCRGAILAHLELRPMLKRIYGPALLE